MHILFISMRSSVKEELRLKDFWTDGWIDRQMDGQTGWFLYTPKPIVLYDQF